MKIGLKKIKYKKVLFACFVLMFFALVVCVIFNTLKISNNYLKHTFVNGINVSGLTSNEANILLKQNYENLKNKITLQLKYKNKVWKFSEDDFKVSSNIHTIAEQIQLHNLMLKTKEQKLNYLKNCKQNGTKLNVAFNYIFVGINKKINTIKNSIYKKPTESTITFKADNKNPFIISKEINGVEVDENLLYERIDESFRKSNNIMVTIPTKKILPNVTQKKNELLTKKLATFKTDVSDSTGNRKFNVSKALNCFNGFVVQPNEEISFNKITGPQTLENGYKIAKIIFNGKFVDGVGGGICQASTTLYNALIRAGVKILEVHKHTLPVRYVPLGLDAMVSEYIADLKFKNTFKNPIYIQTYSTPSSVYVNLYGKENGKMKLDAHSKIVKEIPHLGDVIKTDLTGEFQNKVIFTDEQVRILWPRKGYEVNAYLDYYDSNNKLIKSELIRKETYKPQHGLIVTGAEERPKNLNPITNNVNKEPENNADASTLEEYAYSHAIPVNYCP